MSGGVDSTVTAKLLYDNGFTVGGAIMRLFDNEADIADAKSCAEKLGISFDVIDCRKAFEKHVIKNFVNVYLSGATPNPCVVCNRYVKLGYFLDKALSLGYDKIATGHYARLENNSGRTLLKRGADPRKDQSYVLYGLNQRQLSHILFPLGELSKEEIRCKAREAGFRNADRPDSQDICFIKNAGYGEFIKSYTGKQPPEGDIILTDETVIGRHNGLLNYTIGQRKGLGVSYSEPLFVIRKDIEKNRLVLGTSDRLTCNRFTVESLNLIPFDELTSPIRVTVRTRYHQTETAATVYPLGLCSAEVIPDKPLSAVCPGQSAVFYDGDYVIGGGLLKAAF